MRYRLQWHWLWTTRQQIRQPNCANNMKKVLKNHKSSLLVMSDDEAKHGAGLTEMKNRGLWLCIQGMVTLKEYSRQAFHKRWLLCMWLPGLHYLLYDCIHWIRLTFIGLNQ